MTTTLLFESVSNFNHSLVYAIQTPIKKYIIRFDLSLIKGKDSRIYMQGDDKRWILLLEDSYYERLDNAPNKVQQDRILRNEMTKEHAEQLNDQMKLQRRGVKMTFYFHCLEKLL